ncbi:MAG: hypothetical protein Q8Q01_02800 [archaeon]|nr:hypothetical protein [archaeon]
MAQNIRFRALLEILGKPKEYVEQALKNYVEKISSEEKYTLHTQHISEAIANEKEEGFFSAIAELEISTPLLEDLTIFCLEYMPAQIEIMEPAELALKDADLTAFFNDLQAKLHSIDLVAKTVKMENDSLKRGVNSLLTNYITVLLQGRSMNSEDLGKLTGVEKDRLEDFMDVLIDQGRIDLNDGKYFIVDKKNGNK